MFHMEQFGGFKMCKNKRIEIRITEIEKEYLKDLASQNGMNLSQYIRYIILGSFEDVPHGTMYEDVPHRTMSEV